MLENLDDKTSDLQTSDYRLIDNQMGNIRLSDY